MLEQFKIALHEFRNYGFQIQANAEGKVLLAVSGGVDSVVMADLFFHSGIKCAIAHCNFKLRGEESEGDEIFVKALADNYKFKFHANSFETAGFATDNGMSVQMAARHLRYTWFYELIKLHNYMSVAVAHNENDIAETMLLNLTRGTGLAGMHGIKPVNRQTIRPLLFASREMILKYAHAKDLKWREDSSNLEDSYQRNKLRNRIFPVLKEINPSVIRSFSKHAELMKNYENLTNEYIAALRNELVRQSHHGSILTINLKSLNSYSTPGLILYHLLSEYGFGEEVCREALNSSGTGSFFNSDNFRLTVGREELILMQPDELKEEEIQIGDMDVETDLMFGTISMERHPVKELRKELDNDDFNSNSSAYIDGNKLVFPLTVRRWQKGDYFYPMGMKGKKLLSDYFTDNKFSVAEKETTYLLISEGKVVWVVGKRIDDRFKMDESTTVVRRFTWKEK